MNAWIGKTRWCRLIALAVVVLSALPTLAEPTSVYILTGQSNALGTTRYEGKTPADYGPGADQADGEIELFWSNVRSPNTAYPPEQVGDSKGEIKPLQIQQGGWENPAYWGPEIGFARAMHALSHENILIIKACRGGGGNSLWDPNVFRRDADEGHMWGHLVDTVDAGLAVLDEQDIDFRVKGLLYLQGESNSPEEAAVAGRRLGDLMENLKGRLNAEHRGVADEMQLVIGEIAASDENEARQKTTAQQKRLAEKRKDILFVQTNDLPVKQDGVHFGRDAKLQIGYRMATALHALQTDSDAVAWTGKAESSLWYDGGNWRGLANPWGQCDYRVEGGELTSFDSDNEVFTGRSLTLSSGAAYTWHRTSNGAFKTLTHRIDSFILDSATLSPGSSKNSVRHVFLGKLTLRGQNTFDMNGAGRFSVYLRLGDDAEDDATALVGDGTLEIKRGEKGTGRVVELFADASDFSGEVTIAGLKDKSIALHLYNESGWGKGALHAGPYAEVSLLTERGIDAESATLHLDEKAALHLGNGQHAIASLTIASQTVEPGSYEAADLGRLNIGATFSGQGSLYVTGTGPDRIRIAAPETETE